MLMQISKKRISFGSVLKFIILLIAAVSVLLPFWMLFLASLRGRAVLFEYPPRLWPHDATLDNYWELLTSSYAFVTWFKNSLVVSFFGTLVSVLLCVPAGYAFAKKKFPFKTPLFLMIMATMMVPPTVILFPSFMVIKTIGLVNTLTGMFINTVASAFGMMLIKQHMEGIKTIQIGITGMSSQNSVPWNLIMAATMLSFIPVLVVFLFFRRNFIEGLTAGAIKG